MTIFLTLPPPQSTAETNLKKMQMVRAITVDWSPLAISCGSPRNNTRKCRGGVRRM